MFFKTLMFWDRVSYWTSSSLIALIAELASSQDCLPFPQYCDTRHLQWHPAFCVGSGDPNSALHALYFTKQAISLATPSHPHLPQDCTTCWPGAHLESLVWADLESLVIIPSWPSQCWTLKCGSLHGLCMVVGASTQMLMLARQALWLWAISWVIS